MTSVGFIVGGITLITLAGVFNGSWNASFNPLANLAVGKSDSQNDLTYHHAFALFQIYAVIINIPICLWWAGGPERVGAILAETPPISIILVVVFSLIWGLGTLLFGIACKVAGVGLGTNLSIGIIAVIGTFLPLITENTLFSPFGAIVCVGLAICCIGLWVATKALSQRDEDERQAKSQLDFPLSLDDVKEDDNFIGKDNDQEDSSTEKASDTREIKEYSTTQKFLVCLATGATAVQLQFAFIFGAPITDLATGKNPATLPGSTPFGGSAVIIWLLAISLGAPAAIVNAIVSSPVPLSQALKAPWWRHLRLIVSTSLPWISHIHIYGLCATTLLPEKVAASIGWPLLMMITNLWALLLSKFLGEWKAASQKTVRTFAYSLVVTVIGLLVLMCSVAVPTNT